MCFRWTRDLRRGRSKDRQFLSTSRAFGDIDLKEPAPAVLISTPEIKVMNLEANDWMVIQCCDGIFEALEDDECAKLAWDAVVKVNMVCTP